MVHVYSFDVKLDFDSFPPCSLARLAHAHQRYSLTRAVIESFYPSLFFPLFSFLVSLFYSVSPKEKTKRRFPFPFSAFIPPTTQQPRLAKYFVSPFFFQLRVYAGPLLSQPDAIFSLSLSTLSVCVCLSVCLRSRTNQLTNPGTQRTIHHVSSSS